MIIWARRSTLNKVKKQVRIIVISAVLTMAVTLAADYIAGFYHFPTPTPSLTLIWIGSVFYSIKKYKMIELSPHAALGEMMKSIEDSIVLFNPDRTINWHNENDDRLIQKLLKSGNMLNLFSDNFKIVSLISDLKNRNNSSAVFRYPLRINNGTVIYDVLIKNICDSFEDNLGYLLKAKKVESVDYIQKFYKITKRETDVIKLLISGLTYQDISESLEFQKIH